MGYEQSGYFSTETIAALSSGVGGALAVVRISGPEAVLVLSRLVSPAVAAAEAGGVKATKSPVFLHATAKRVALVSGGGEPIDDAVVTAYFAPKSFTGEDLVELSVHGNPLIVESLLTALAAAGARPALPGEFAFRAVRNGKISLNQAEAIAELIEAPNWTAVQYSLERVLGTQKQKIEWLSKGLKDLLTMAELGIDFSDQEVPDLALSKLRARIPQYLEEVRSIAETYERGRRIQQGIVTVVAGAPNVGKSSLFNALVGADSSIVTPIAGTTRDVVKEWLVLKGKNSSLQLRLEDTAGIRESSDLVEGLGIDRSRQSIRSADIVVFVVDAAQDLGEARRLWLELISGNPLRMVIGVLNKADLLSSEQRKKIEAELRARGAFEGIQEWIWASALQPEGVGQLKGSLLNCADRWMTRSKGEFLLTKERHFRAFQNAALDLDRALTADQPELLAADLRQALFSLSPVIGEFTSDEILTKIFSEFCIGK